MEYEGVTVEPKLENMAYCMLVHSSNDNRVNMYAYSEEKCEEELARSLTHGPSSQGWAFRSPVIVCLFVCMTCRVFCCLGCGWEVSFFSF